jgi:hypothetical protein
MSPAKLSAVPAHRPQDAADTGSTEDRDLDAATTCADSQRWARNPARLAAHQLVTRAVGLAASSTSSQPVVARSLGISTRALQRYADPEGAQRITLADVVASRPDFARAVLVTTLASIPGDQRTAPRAPEAHAMRLSAAVGDVAERIDEATSDGSLTREERRAIARDLQSLIERAQAALRDLGDG